MKFGNIYITLMLPNSLLPFSIGNMTNRFPCKINNIQPFIQNVLAPSIMRVPFSSKSGSLGEKCEEIEGFKCKTKQNKTKQNKTKQNKINKSIMNKNLWKRIFQPSRQNLLIILMFIRRSSNIPHKHHFLSFLLLLHHFSHRF